MLVNILVFVSFLVLAIWMLPEDYVYGEWPRSGEIDLVEVLGMWTTHSARLLVCYLTPNLFIFIYDGHNPMHVASVCLTHFTCASSKINRGKWLKLYKSGGPKRSHNPVPVLPVGQK